MLRKLLIVPVTMKITAFKNYFTSAARSLLCDVMACLVAANGLLVAVCGFSYCGARSLECADSTGCGVQA